MTAQSNRPGGEPEAVKKSLAGDTPILPRVSAELCVRIGHRSDWETELFRAMPPVGSVSRLVLDAGYLLDFDEIVIRGASGSQLLWWRRSLEVALERAAVAVAQPRAAAVEDPAVAARWQEVTR